MQRNPPSFHLLLPQSQVKSDLVHVKKGACSCGYQGGLYRRLGGTALLCRNCWTHPERTVRIPGALPAIEDRERIVGERDVPSLDPDAAKSVEEEEEVREPFPHRRRQSSRRVASIGSALITCAMAGAIGRKL